VTLISCDNGATGYYSIIDNGALVCIDKYPVVKALHHSQKGKFINRLDVKAFVNALQPYSGHIVKAVIERPFTTNNTMYINAMLNAARFLEATIIAFELAGIGYEIVDSKKWQSYWLKGIKGSENLKAAAYSKALQINPEFAKHCTKEADSYLMGMYYFRNRE
jgi:hypothetical protein